MTAHDELGTRERCSPLPSRAGDRLARDTGSGSATAELVVLLPVIGALLLAILAGAQGLIANAAVMDAAASAARLAARGDAIEPALDRFDGSGRAVQWSQRRQDDFLCVTVRLAPRPAALISFPTEAVSCALVAE
ncbi:TadE/TadG family type IV pilus assembly protein [Naasia lichenicola]|uniref:TadE-like domain-containing protein n=1 Tax=Naasia lichenicola TaxID=2565933 RepID=A0A4S4FL43_9MICO|nr:TadE/TadG family type IV pilus assembly protein [Naasia lichenicola]THG30891.1 hypothetical protein E6C64_09725 [Naasia lichenicola]